MILFFVGVAANCYLLLLLLSFAVTQAAGRLLAKGRGPWDGQLFVIQHLLFLREQIAQFDVDFSVTDVDLDFTHMRDHMRRILSGEHPTVSILSGQAGTSGVCGTQP